MKRKKRIKNDIQLYKAQNGIAPQFQLNGDRCLLAEGCRGMAEYDDNTVRLNLPKGQLLITGRELCLEQMDAACVSVTGKLQTLEFIGGSYESVC